MRQISLNISHTGDNGFSLHIECKVPASGVTAIYGPSGSGKTTVLNAVAGIQPASGNSTIVFGNEQWQSGTQITPPWKRKIGFVFQDARLFPHLNVRQNLEYAIKRRGDESQPSFDEIVDWLNLEAQLARLPEQLSAGQQQRVAIGRALLSGPRILLMDEPLANLDHAAKSECLRYLQRLRAELDIPILYVSHDIEEISQIADNLLLLEHGRLEAQGSLIDLCGRLDTRLSHEEQAAAIVTGAIQHHDTEFGLTEIRVDDQTLLVNHLEAPLGQQQRLRIPARDVSICRARPHDSSILNIIPVELLEIEATGGSRVLLRLSLGEQYLLARITRKSAEVLQLAVGDKVFAQIKSAALLSQATTEPA
ncbi:MAG: molybdate transport system ATP-binding protein [Halioglobus sp.]